MRVLVTGATGFVGRAVTARLLAQGYSVTALSRDPAVARARLPEAVTILPWKPDASGPQGPPNLPRDIDAVIHLAGASIAGGLWTASRKKKLWASRVEGTRALVNALAGAGTFPAVFVSASGMGYHGDGGDRVVRPADAPGTDFLARMAAAWEAEALKARDFGARAACIRLGMVLGKGGGALPPQILATRLGLGAVLGTGRQYWPWIRVETAADLFVAALRSPGFDGPVHGVSGPPVTQRAFAKTLGRALRRPVFFRIPAGALRLALGEMADLFLHGQRTESGTGQAPLPEDALFTALREIG